MGVGKGEADKATRLIDISLRLATGESINKREAANMYHVNERTIQRDLEVIRTYYEDRMTQSGNGTRVVYNRKQKGYILCNENATGFTNGEALAVSKILLESRAFPREEMFGILDKILNGCVPADRKKQVKELLLNEEFCYVPLKHNRMLIDIIWELGQAVQAKQRIHISYMKMDGVSVRRIVEPIGILFSEFYFYLIAFAKKDGAEISEECTHLSPTIYRIDRIDGYQLLKEHFEIPYRARFQEGEFRKRIQFMYGGELRKVRFEYMGPSVEAVLDRLPTAIVEKEEGGIYTVSAEVFGDGIDMWLRSQGKYIKKILK